MAFVVGLDSSGNNNNWSSTNLASGDVTLDTPLNNFATLNPLSNWSDFVFTQGNKIGTLAPVNGAVMPSFALPSTGKWYCEFKFDEAPGYAIMGVGRMGMMGWNSSQEANADVAYLGSDGVSSPTSWWGKIGNFTVGSSSGTQFATDTTNIFGLLWDADNTTLKVYNGTNTYQSTFTVGDIVGQDIGFIWGASHASQHGKVRVNFGQDSTFSGNKARGSNTDAAGLGEFFLTVPAGYKSLCTANLPDPSVALPEDHFNTVLWTGASTSAAKSVTGVGFQPDFVWSKSRSDAFHWNNYDSLTGAGQRLSSNTDAAAAANHAYGYLSSFDSDGFTTTAGSTNNENFNKTSSAFVAWNWKAGGVPTANNSAGVGNVPTAGSVKIDGVNSGAALTGTAAVTRLSASTTAGFSIATFTASSGVTIDHGLGVKPDFGIFKRTSGTGDWLSWTYAANANNYLRLNTTAARDDYGSATSSVITTQVGSGSVTAYIFASKEGYSKIGTYYGNGSANGPFVYTGFRPAWLVARSIQDVSSWYTWDIERNTYNMVNTGLWLNGDGSGSTWAEETAAGYGVDFLSNGFKPRFGSDYFNKSGRLIFYMAFAEYPFKYANAK